MVLFVVFIVAGAGGIAVQLNTIIYRHDGTPVALTGSTWGVNAHDQITNVLSDYGTLSSVPCTCTRMLRTTTLLPDVVCLSSINSSSYCSSVIDNIGFRILG